MILFVDDAEERWLRFQKLPGGSNPDTAIWADTCERAMQVLDFDLLKPPGEISQVWLDFDAGAVWTSNWTAAGLRDSCTCGASFYPREPHDATCPAAEITTNQTNRMVALSFKPVVYMLCAMKFTGRIVLHSANPTGREWMTKQFKAHGIEVEDKSNLFYGD